MFLLSLYVSIRQFLQRGYRVLRFFTIWNWCGLVFYFAFTAAASLRALRSNTRAAARNSLASKESEEAGLEDKIVATLFHLLLPVRNLTTPIRGLPQLSIKLKPNSSLLTLLLPCLNPLISDGYLY